MGHNGRPRLDPDNIPPDKHGRPRTSMTNGTGRPPLDWDTIIPQLLDEVSRGMPINRALRTLHIPDTGDVWRKLSSPEWKRQKQEALHAGALARLDKSHDRLLTLAEAAPGEIKREQIDAARWESEHAKWMAERSDSETWGREDRLKVAQVSAIRVIVETPPTAAALPAGTTVYEALPVETETPRQLTGGESGE